MITNFSVYLPLTGSNQDSEPISNDKCLIVCDGLGGDGSSRHKVNNDTHHLEKSAYLGSREVSRLCQAFFSSHYDALLNPSELSEAISQLKSTIITGLNEYLTNNPKADENKGGMVFPTTLASAVFRECDDHIELTAIWAGDSRVYAFDEEKGLQQLSMDDVEGEFDACFGKDCRMRNCISQDNDFTINFAQYSLPAKSIVFVCSDGCFDFLPSPIHFENQVILGLYDLDSIGTNESKLKVSIEKIGAGDDCTLAGFVSGFQSEKFGDIIKSRWASIRPMIVGFDEAKKGNAVSEDVRKEIRELNSENKALNQTIITDIRRMIVSAFREYCSDTDQTQKDLILIQASDRMREIYSPYNTYLLEREKSDSERKRLAETQKDCFSDLKAKVDSAERKKRVVERQERQSRKNSFFPFVNPDFGRNILFGSGRTNNQMDYQQQVYLQRYYQDCGYQADQLIQQLNMLKNAPDNYANQRARHNLQQNVNYIIEILSKIEDAKSTVQQGMEEDQIVLSEDELTQRIMPVVVKDGVQCYRVFLSGEEFAGLLESYNTYMNIKQQLDSFDESFDTQKSLDETVKVFEDKFLRQHFSIMSEIIIGDSVLGSRIPSAVKYRSNVERLNSIQSELDSGNEQQRRIWEKYRKNYEAYRSSINSGTC